MKILYTTEVTSTGGRNGHVKSADNLLDVDIGLPKSVGGKDGDHLNPETFFAAGYAACFENALIYIMGMQKITGAKTAVTARVHLLELESGGWGLAVKLIVDVKGVDKVITEQLVKKAHEVCPYSNATRGNGEVEIEVS